MLAVIAAIVYGLGFLLSGSGAHVNQWLAPMPLMLLGSFCMALHFAGIGTAWTARRPN